MKPIELSLFFVLLLSIVHGEETMKESEKATFGAGCFWCVEAVFQRLEGVKDVVPGYCGGTKVNPTYNEVCTGRTQKPFPLMSFSICSGYRTIPQPKTVRVMM